MCLSYMDGLIELHKGVRLIGASQSLVGMHDPYMDIDQGLLISITCQVGGQWHCGELIHVLKSKIDMRLWCLGYLFSWSGIHPSASAGKPRNWIVCMILNNHKLCNSIKLLFDSHGHHDSVLTSAKQPNLATGLTVHTPLYKPVQAVQTYPTLVSIILSLYKSVQAV